MGNIYVFFDMGVPQIGCTDCGNCRSIMGKSLCGIVNRGCCHYFPEFTLVDIQRMVVLEGGRKALDTIFSNPGTIVNSFNIYAKGLFDKEAYDEYLAGGNLLETGSIRDHTIFFRTCPFVKPGSGCKLPPRFRTTVCNFFVCEEILRQADLQDVIKDYMQERSRYARWIYRESGILQHVLEENGLNLKNNFKASLELLAELGQMDYDFPMLEPVAFRSVPGTFPVSSGPSASGTDTNGAPITTSTL